MLQHVEIVIIVHKILVIDKDKIRSNGPKTFTILIGARLIDFKSEPFFISDVRGTERETYIFACFNDVCFVFLLTTALAPFFFYEDRFIFSTSQNLVAIFHPSRYSASCIFFPSFFSDSWPYLYRWPDSNSLLSQFLLFEVQLSICLWRSWFIFWFTWTVCFKMPTLFKSFDNIHILEHKNN